MGHLSPHLVSELMDANVLLGRGAGTVILDLPPGDKFPGIKEEIFRLVEGSFATIGGETGKGIKTDEFNENIFHQLIPIQVSSDRTCTILAGYRYALWEGLKQDIKTPMTQSFDIDDPSLDPQYAKVIELGTARGNPFIDKKLQAIGFGNTWYGLAALIDRHDNDYFVGKLTIPAGYHPKARDFAISYLQGCTLPPYFLNMSPKKEYNYMPDPYDIQSLSKDFREDEKEISNILRELTNGKESYLPAMFPMYLPRLFPEKFHCTGTIQNGKVCETGIVVPLGAIRPEVYASYKKALEPFQQKYGSNPNITLGEYMGH